MSSTSQVIFFCSFFLLQFFEELVELPSSEDIAECVKEQDQRREELHSKVWLRTSCVIFPDANVLKSGSSTEEKYHNFYIDAIIYVSA